MLSGINKLNSVRKEIDFVLTQPLSEVIGTPLDQTRIIIAFISQFPIGWFMFYCIRGATVRHFYSMFSGIAIALFVYGLNAIHIIAMSSIAYTLMIVLPRKD